MYIKEKKEKNSEPRSREGVGRIRRRRILRKPKRDNAAGFDVHKEFIEVYWCRSVSPDEIEEDRERFGTTTPELLRLAAWLLDHDCQHVCMESTGQYWVPIWNVLESFIEEIQLCNPKWVKAVKDHKDDKKDAQWICELFRSGYTRASFIPARVQWDIRNLTRLVKNHTQQKTQLLNQRNNALHRNNIRFDVIFSNQNTKSARKIIDLMLSGKKYTDDDIMACVHKKCKASREDILAAVHGINIRPAAAVELNDLNKAIDEKEEHIKGLQKEINKMAKKYFGQYIDLLMTIPGINQKSAIIILSEIGFDMSFFPSPEQMTSWAGLAPGTNESAGIKKSKHVTKGNRYLKSLLIQCAWSAVRNNSYYRFKFLTRAKRMGKKRAIVAIARMMLVAIWHILSKGEGFKPTDVANADEPIELMQRMCRKDIRRSLVELFKSGKKKSEIMKEIKDFVDTYALDGIAPTKETPPSNPTEAPAQ